MNLKTEQFCALATAPAWHAWLYSFDRSMYDDLATHLGRGSSCRSNGEKMVAILGQISSSGQGQQRLESFLRQQFPHVLVEEVPPAYHGGGGVFDHYDPELLTVPRRVVLAAGSEAGARHLADKFLADKIAGEAIVLLDQGVWVACVEYLPVEMGSIAHLIPPDNWRTKTYKAAR